MALQRTTTLGQRIMAHEGLVRVGLVLAAVIVLMLVMTVAFGVHLSGPSFQIVPDPAGTLPF